MYAIATFIVVAVISLLFARLLTGALIATGVPPSVAKFQARSAMTGAGFTTKESESLVNDPLRRRIISLAMFLGNLGTPTLVVTVLLGFLAPGPGDTFDRLVVFLAGIVVVLAVLSSGFVTNRLVEFGRRTVSRRFVDVLDDELRELVEVDSDYLVAELRLRDDPGSSPRSIRGAELALPGLRVLGIRPADGGPYVGEPPSDIDLRRDDRLVVYGRRSRLEELVSGDG